MTTALVERPDRVQAVESAFALLEIIIAAGGDATLSELATGSELPPPAFRRLLRTCVELGCLRQLPSRRYGLGARFMRLGESAIWQIGSVVRPSLVELVGELGESASIVLRDGDTIVCVAQQSSPQVMRTVTEVGTVARLHDTAAGKAILAALTSAQVRQTVARTGLVTSTPNAHRSLRTLSADLAAIRRQGYAVDHEEQELGARSYAVTIPRTRTPMAVSVSGPLSRVDDAFGARAVPILRRMSDQLSGDLAN